MFVFVGFIIMYYTMNVQSKYPLEFIIIITRSGALSVATRCASCKIF